MSLDFKKREYGTEAAQRGNTPPVSGKGSALSMLLEKSKGDETPPPGSGPPSPTATAPSVASPSSPSVDRFDSAQPGVAIPRPGSATSMGPLRAGSRPTAEPGSMRIPSSSYRRSSNVQSSLQQQRDRARTGESSFNNTPSASVLGSSAGYGPLFGAGEIGNVSSPRHYSVPITRERFDPSSVDERFVVNIPGKPSRKSSVSSSTATPVKASSVHRTNSSASIMSQSSSKSSMMSLRRFMEKPWKHETPLGSPQSATFSIGASPPGSSPQSRKGSVASFTSSDEESNGANLGSSYDSGSNLSASLTQLDEQYASSYHRHNSLHNRMKKSLKAYGKLGRTLGEGAGGHVKIIRSNIDSKIYAVKEFRARHPSETLREYNKKVGGEYCLGLTLSHPNIVNTIDIIYETDKVYQVMEYASYDLFAIVMSGRMSREEVYCDFRQLMEGVRYLHHSGLAHRDFKLDNCVVTDQGIVKIIDFGSSVVYRYPDSDRTYDCHGVVGSDPYLAPEAAGKGRYLPTPTDIWSSAIVLCCMLMRKFPWKAPRMSDSSFKAFVAEEPDGSHPGMKKLLSSLPEETHGLLSGMLDLNPESRFTIDQCWDEGFLDSEPHCTIINDQVVHAPGHVHTQVSFEDAHIAMLEKKNRKAKKGEKMW